VQNQGALSSRVLRIPIRTLENLGSCRHAVERLLCFFYKPLVMAIVLLIQSSSIVRSPRDQSRDGQVVRAAGDYARRIASSGKPCQGGPQSRGLDRVFSTASTIPVRNEHPYDTSHLADGPNDCLETAFPGRTKLDTTAPPSKSQSASWRYSVQRARRNVTQE
jgi:hypothetical protein